VLLFDYEFSNQSSFHRTVISIAVLFMLIGGKQDSPTSPLGSHSDRGIWLSNSALCCTSARSLAYLLYWWSNCRLLRRVVWLAFWWSWSGLYLLTARPARCLPPSATLATDHSGLRRASSPFRAKVNVASTPAGISRGLRCAVLTPRDILRWTLASGRHRVTHCVRAPSLTSLRSLRLRAVLD